MLTDGMYDVPAGKLATVVTHLEMHAKAPSRAIAAPTGVTLTSVTAPTCDWYRDIFRRVGGDWLWLSRLKMAEPELEAILQDPKVKIWTLQKDGGDHALLELDFRTEGSCELAFFGLTPELIGTGAGRFLMNAAIETAWAAPISRFHLQTCTLDSQQALSFYRRSGFVPYGQQVEIISDPRLDGTAGYTRAHAPHVPIVEPKP